MQTSVLLPRKRTALQRRHLVLATAAAALGCPALAQPQPIRIGRTDYVSPISEIEERVLGEAFKRLGQPVQFVKLPLLRLIEMANAGDIDGDIGRIPEVAQRFPNLLMLPTPICQVDVAVYGKARDFAERTRSDIMGLNTGIVRGVFVLSKHSKGMKVTEAQNFEAITQMLDSQRIEAAMVVFLDTEVLLQAPGAPSLVRWPYLWASEPLHCLLHKSHAALVPRLENVLAQMAKEGLIRRYYADELRRIGVTPLRAIDAAPR